MSIGDNIKNLRLKHGLEQWQIAEIAGVTNKAVSSWERGNSVPRMGAIEKIANYFNIKKSEIIEDDFALTSLSEIDFAMLNSIKKLNDSDKKNIMNIINSIVDKK